MKTSSAIVAGSAALLTFATGAYAQASLETYFNLRSYGTVSANQTITDATGNTQATLNTDPSTSMTSSGLTIAAGPAGNAGSTGLTLAAGSLNSFTGSFTIQDWVTPAAGGGVVLFGGNSGAENTYIGDGYTGVSTLIGFNWGSLVGGGGTGNPLGQPYNRYGNTVAGYTLTAGQPYDLVLTYNAPTYTFNQYINGTLIGSLQEAFSSTSLAGVQDFGIGGAPNEPWVPFGDSSAAETTSDFLLYQGALTPGQVSAVDALGAGASLGAINAVVPEPSTWALFFGGLGSLSFAARRRAQA